MAFIDLFAIFGFVLGFLYYVQPKSKSGIIEINGQEFPYKLGNRLIRFWSGSYMNGIDIELPKELPHMYLDGRANNRQLGERMYGNKSQRISLEGNFNDYFQAYVPTGYETLALSILSPDVLQTIMQSASKYDVEIYGSHVRIICRKGVYSKSNREAELIQIANVIMKEIAHRLRSWSEHDSQNAHKATLIMHQDSELAFGADNKNLLYSAVFTAAMSLLPYWTGYSWQRIGNIKYTLICYGLGFIIFPGMLLFVWATGRKQGTKSR